MSYEPKPGTIPHRAIEKLSALDEGAELTNVKLAEMMGRAPSTLLHDLEAAIKRGAVIARPGEHGTKIIWLSLGAKPLKATPSHAEVLAMARNGNGALPGALVAQLSKPAQAAADVEAEVARAWPLPPIKAARASKAEPKPEVARFRCALWSDGTLTVEHGGEALEFTADEAKTLRLYLCDGVTP